MYSFNSGKLNTRGHMPSISLNSHTFHKRVHILSMQVHALHELDEAKEPRAPASMHQRDNPITMPRILSLYRTMRSHYSYVPIHPTPAHKMCLSCNTLHIVFLVRQKNNILRSNLHLEQLDRSQLCASRAFRLTRKTFGKRSDLAVKRKLLSTNCTYKLDTSHQLIV